VSEWISILEGGFYADGRGGAVTGDVEASTGHPPRSFAEYAAGLLPRRRAAVAR